MLVYGSIFLFMKACILRHSFDYWWLVTEKCFISYLILFVKCGKTSKFHPKYLQTDQNNIRIKISYMFQNFLGTISNNTLFSCCYNITRHNISAELCHMDSSKRSYIWLLFFAYQAQENKFLRKMYIYIMQLFLLQICNERVHKISFKL